MNWSSRHLENHVKASRLLHLIIKNTFSYLQKRGEGVSEYEVQQYIVDQIRKKRLRMDKDAPIVAFNESSAVPHYFPLQKSKKLVHNSLVLLDLWARLDEYHAPFADITWVGFYGRRVPKRITQVFTVVREARDVAIEAVRTSLQKGIVPSGAHIDEVSIRKITQEGFAHAILHRTGHSIGFHSPHGKKSHLNAENQDPIEKNMGYTIEPGIYIPDEFGIRSEVDFYVDARNKMVVTTPVQRSIILI